MFENKFLVVLISVLVIKSFISASPVFENIQENIVEDSADNSDDNGFERANDGPFMDSNDFSFEPDAPSSNKDPQENNQSVEQESGGEDDGAPFSQNAREKPSADVNKATAEEQESSNDDDGSNEANGPRNESGRKQKYADGDENSGRSLSNSSDGFESFDKESDKEFDNNVNDEPNEQSNRRPNSAEENGPRGRGELPMPPPALQIDEPIIVNGGPIPLPLHGPRPPLINGRSNNDENEGGNYRIQKSNSPKKINKIGALGIKYLHEKPGLSKTRIAQPEHLAFFADQHSATESEEQGAEEGEQEEPNVNEYMNQWIARFERDPALLNSLGASVQNVNYGIGGSRK